MKGPVILALAVVGLLGGCATHPDREVLRFDGDYGALTLEVDWAAARFLGDYPAYDGRMTGTALRAPDGRTVLSGVWIQPRSDRRCEATRDGGRFWGRFLMLREAGRRPEGFWGYCDEPPGNVWPIAGTP